MPKVENVSYNILLSMDLSRFLMKMFPLLDLRRDGSAAAVVISAGLAPNRSAAREALTTVGPHDANWLATDHGVVHGVQSPLSVRHKAEVDVGVAEWAPSDSITANANGLNWTNLVEEVTEVCLCDVGEKISDVKGRGCIRCSSVLWASWGSGRGLCRCLWSCHGERRVRFFFVFFVRREGRRLPFPCL